MALIQKRLLDAIFFDRKLQQYNKKSKGLMVNVPAAICRDRKLRAKQRMHVVCMDPESLANMIRKEPVPFYIVVMSADNQS